jgi:phage tail P2-like protein
MSALPLIDKARFATALAAAREKLAGQPITQQPSLLPNPTPLMRALEQAIGRLEAIPVPIASAWNPDTCPVELLPYLAWSLSIDVWSPDWPEAVKRERIRRAMIIQQSKGTRSSIEEVVAAFGGSVAIREWWEMVPPGRPHTFDMILGLTGAGGYVPSAALVDQVITDITRTKPVRSHFTFTLSLSAVGSIGKVGAIRPVSYARLRLDAAPAF